MFIVKQAGCQRLGQLGFADARRAEEQETADRPVRIRNPRPRAEYGFGNLCHSLVLADHTLMQDILQMKQLLPLSFHQLADRDSGPPGYDPGNFLFGHGIMDKGTGFFLFAALFRFLQAFFQGGQIRILQLCRRFVFISELSVLDIAFQLFDLPLQRFDFVHAVFFRFPAGFHLIELILEFRQLCTQFFQSIQRKLIRFLFQRHFFDLQLHNLPPHIVQFRRHGVNLRPDLRAGFIHQVDCLIRQKPICNIPIGQCRGCHQSIIVDAHTVVYFVAFFQSAQDRDRILYSRFIHQDWLETPLKSRILFNILTIFIKCCRADTVKLAPGQHRFQQVAGIHAAFRLSCTDNGMKFVDKEDDPAFGLTDLFQNGFQSFFKLTAVFCSGDKRTHI